MRTIVKVRHTKVPPEVKTYATEKVNSKILSYLPQAGDEVICDIELDDQFGDKGGYDKRVEITLSLPHQHLPLRIEENDPTFYEAIDKAVDRLDRSLERYKDIHR